MEPVFVDQPVAGMLCGGTHAGIRKAAKDLAVFYSVKPASFACVNTTNHFAAAPNRYNQTRVRNTAQLIVANSGTANAATGETGLRHCQQVARHAARAFHLPSAHVALASTGLTGKPLPVGNLVNAIHGMRLSNTATAWRDAATAIQTTDRTLKYASVEAGGARVVGVAKGAGMINPAMATMLCFLFTDAPLSPGQTRLSLAQSVEQSFNRINVDGCQSTNDTVMLMANGCAPNADADAIQPALDAVCRQLAQAIVHDGEGAQQTFELTIHHARDATQAGVAAKAILNNALVQTAFAAKNPNTGRLVAALGSANISLDPERVTIHVQGQEVFSHQCLRPFSWTTPADAVRIDVDLGQGTHEATFYGCDLSTQYVTLNKDYTT